MNTKPTTTASPAAEASQKPLTNLDSLVKELNADELRNIAGGMTDRPKGCYGTDA